MAFGCFPSKKSLGAKTKLGTVWINISCYVFLLKICEYTYLLCWCLCFCWCPYVYDLVRNDDGGAEWKSSLRFLLLVLPSLIISAQLNGSPFVHGCVPNAGKRIIYRARPAVCSWGGRRGAAQSTASGKIRPRKRRQWDVMCDPKG